MDVQVIKPTKIRTGGGRANSTHGGGTCPHTIQAQDLRITKPIPGQGGLSMVLKLQ